MLTIQDVKNAQQRLAPYIYKTPLIRMNNVMGWQGTAALESLDELPDADVQFY